MFLFTTEAGKFEDKDWKKSGPIFIKNESTNCRTANVVVLHSAACSRIL